MPVRSGMSSQIPKPLATRIHHVDFSVPISDGGECNPLTIRRPCRLGVLLGVVCQLLQISAINIYHEYVKGSERNPLTVRRPCEMEVIAGLVG